MKLAIVGVGGAGGKILDRLLEYDADRDAGFTRHAVAVDTAKGDLEGLARVPDSNRLLVGESIGGGQGTGADPAAGRAAVEDDLEEIQSAIDRVATGKIDALLVLAGLGGGTGGGGAPLIAERLGEIHAEPVYGLGILPSTDEGGIYSRNAARALQRFVEHTDNVLLFDSEAFESRVESVAEIETTIAARFGTLFSAGEADAEDGTVAESVVDSSEVVNTLGDRGLSSVGYATEEVETKGGGLLSRLLGSKDTEPEFVSAGNATNRITSLARQATLRKLTLPCEIESASRALVIVAGPPEHLDRKGLEEARRWIEEKTNCQTVRTGDYPRPDSDRVAVLVLLSGITAVPRIEEIQTMAAEFERTAESRDGDANGNVRDLVEYDDPE